MVVRQNGIFLFAHRQFRIDMIVWVIGITILSSSSTSYLSILRPAWALSSPSSPTAFTRGPGALPVEQIDLQTGKVLNVFPTAQNAALSLGLDPNAIDRVVQGNDVDTSVGGFSWRRAARNSLNKVPIEKICPKTGNVLGVFPSITEARLSANVTKSQISQVIQGKAQTTGGFFWRIKGSSIAPPQRKQRKQQHCNGNRVEQVCLETGHVLHTFESIEEATNSFNVSRTSMRKALSDPTMSFAGFSFRSVARPVEKVCLSTGKVLDTFPSATAAAQSANANTRQMRDVLSGKGMSCKGFFWRYEGSTSTPSPKAYRKPVEKVCLSTGKVLESFPSATAAAQSVNTNTGHMSRVLTGKYKSCKGFFWRYEGSTSTPSPKQNWKPVEKVCLSTGKVLESFPSVTAAAQSINATTGHIILVLTGKASSCKGFFWRYEGSTSTPPLMQ